MNVFRVACVACMGFAGLLDFESVHAQSRLAVSLEASGGFSRSHDWTIEKQVTPASVDRFIGETQQLGYLLTLTKGEPQDAGFRVTGRVDIVNGGSVAATLTAITVTYGDAVVANSCTTATLAAGASRSCMLDFAATDATPRLLRVDVDTGGPVGGSEDSITVAFGAPTLVNDSVTVTDTRLPDALSFSASGTHAYTHDVTCVDGNSIVVDNVAAIEETGDSDATRARVACHSVRMQRDVYAVGSNGWSWDIEKSHAQAVPLQLVAGQSFAVEYTITATATATGSNQITGAITAINTNPVSDAILVSVGGAINGTPVTPACPSLIVPHATYDANRNIVVGTLVCPFTITLPEGEAATTVSGRVTQQLYYFAADGSATPSGTRDHAGTQRISIGATTQTDECVQLSDLYLGATTDLGQFCASAGNTSVTRLFTGVITVAENAECQFSVPNLARLITNDSASSAEDTTLVQVVRTDCAMACVRSAGYWSTHSSYGPAPTDPVWSRVGEDTRFFLSQGSNGPRTWYEVMHTPSRGNVYFTLARQFVAATLNLEAGATASPQVLDALDEAQQLFETYTESQIAALKGGNPLRQRFVELAGVLDQYNNGKGDIGPAACSQDKLSVD